MGFNFPSSPTNGQTYEPVGGPVFVWDGTAWKSQTTGVPVTVYVGDNAPPNPALGQLWWESDSGNLFIWYADGDSAQWVQVSGMPKTDPPTALARNRIVNGAMQVSQENGNNGSGTSVSNTYYPADQWITNWTLSPGTGNTQRLSAAPITPSNSNYIVFNIATPKGTLGASDTGHIHTAIEGSRIRDFLWGSSAAKQVILTFMAYTNAPGTYNIAIRNDAPDRSFLAPFTISTALVWEKITIVIPGDTTGTWGTDTGVGLRLSIALAMGSSFQGVAGWQAGSKLSLPGSANFAAAANGIRFTEVGLYLDPDNTGLAPPWQMPDEAEELRACQRYWANGWCQYSGPTTSTVAYRTPPTATPQRMRVNPALTLLDGGAAAAFPATSGGTAALGVDYFYESRVANATGNGGLYRSTFVANSRM